jgi:hypothetical protein
MAAAVPWNAVADFEAIYSNVIIDVRTPKHLGFYDVFKDAIEASSTVTPCVTNTRDTLFEFAIRQLGNTETCTGYDSRKKQISKIIIERARATPGYFSLPVNTLKKDYLSGRNEHDRMPQDLRYYIVDSGTDPLKFFPPASDGYMPPQNIIGPHICLDKGPSAVGGNGEFYPALDGTGVSTLEIPGGVFNAMMGDQRRVNLDGVVKTDIRVTGGNNIECILTFNLSGPFIDDLKELKIHTSNGALPIQVVWTNRDTYRVYLKGILGSPKIEKPELHGIFDGNTAKNTFFNDNRRNMTYMNKLKGVLFIFCKEFLGDVFIGLIGKHYAMNNEEDDCSVFTCDGVLSTFLHLTSVSHVVKNRGEGFSEAIFVRFSVGDPEELRNAMLKDAKLLFLNSVISHNDDLLKVSQLIKERTITEIDQVGSILQNPKIDEYFKSFNESIFNIIEFLEEGKDAGQVRDDIDDLDMSLEDFKDTYKMFKVQPIFTKLVNGDEVQISRCLKDPFNQVMRESVDITAQNVNTLFINFLISIKGKQGRRGIIDRLEVQGRAGRVKRPKVQGGAIQRGGATPEYLQIGDPNIRHDMNEWQLQEYLKNPLSPINEDYTGFIKNIIKHALTLAGNPTIIINGEEYSYLVDDIFNIYYMLCDVKGVIIENASKMREVLSLIIRAEGAPEIDIYEEYSNIVDECKRLDNLSLNQYVLRNLPQIPEAVLSPRPAVRLLTPPRRPNRVTRKKQNPQLIIIIEKIKEILKKPGGAKELRQYINRQPYDKKKLFMKGLRRIGIQVGRGRNKTKKLSNRRKTHKK